MKAMIVADLEGLGLFHDEAELGSLHGIEHFDGSTTSLSYGHKKKPGDNTSR